MSELLLSPVFWSAVSAFAWPAAFIVAILLFKERIRALLTGKRLKAKFADFELDIGEAVEKTSEDVGELRDRLIELEQKLQLSTDATENNRDKGLRLLWVDDFPSNNAMIIDHFLRNGIQVDLSAETEDAIRKVSHVRYDLLISDLGRIENGIDNPFAGLELTRRLRQGGFDMPLLIFSGRRGLENRKKLLDAGATDVTASAIDVQGFVERVRRMKGT
ncbi:response regulator transcription factor [Salinarimonas sp. NSM]|uniref:response regulator transcription factor n=1 Tax=Salinarimonas sp. NSM TaxID=3458003 RepID=UPI0040374F8E